MIVLLFFFLKICRVFLSRLDANELSAIVVDDTAVGDVMSVPHNHRDWLICLFAVRRFGHIACDPKNKGARPIIPMKNKGVWCLKAFVPSFIT